MRICRVVFGICAGVLLLVSTARADVTVYSNISNFSGHEEPAFGGGNLNGLRTSLMLFDDITPVAGYAGSPVTSITFVTANLDAPPIVATAIIDIYDNSGTRGIPDTPGKLLASFTDSNLDFSGVQAFTIDPAGSFVLPGGTFWAGLSFVGYSPGLGMGIFGPPTIGTSSDFFFFSMNPNSIGADSPFGQFVTFGGAAPADLGWAFSVEETAVPEPESWSIVAGSLFYFVGVAGRRRLKDCQAKKS